MVSDDVPIVFMPSTSADNIFPEYVSLDSSKEPIVKIICTYNKLIKYPKACSYQFFTNK